MMRLFVSRERINRSRMIQMNFVENFQLQTIHSSPSSKYEQFIRLVVFVSSERDIVNDSLKQMNRSRTTNDLFL